MTPEMINGLFAVGGAVAGAIVSAALALGVHHRTKEKRELSVLLSKPRQLVNVHDSVKDSIKISVAGRTAETASHLDYYIANTGNKVLENVNVLIETVGDTDIFGGCTPDSNFGASWAEDTEVSWEDNGTFTIKSDFLNPGDELSGYILLANIPSDVRVSYRAPGVNLKLIKDHDSDRGSVFEGLIFEVAKRNFILDAYLRLAIPAYKEQRRKDDL